MTTMSGIVSPQSESHSSPNNDDKFIDGNRAPTLLRGFSVLYKNKQFVDVTLVVGDHDFPCHRNVLAVTSPFFMALFSNDLAESRQDRIQIKSLDPHTMEQILDYVYTGEVVLSEESVQNLLSAGNLFQLISLRNGCADYMIKHVSITNCIGVYFFARAHQCEDLASKAKEIINSKFTVLCKEQEFLSLPSEKLIEIISDDHLNVTQEEIVYEASLSWLHFDLENRRPDLYKVMSCVRFANISSYYFCDKIDSNSLLQSCDSLRGILDKVKYYHMLHNRQLEIDLNFAPRSGMNYVRGIIIMANPYNEDNNKKYNSMEILITANSKLKTLCKLPQSLYMPGSAVTGCNHIYLAGGALRKTNYRGPFAAEGVSNNLFVYDQAFGSWQVKCKMHQARSQHCLTMVDGYMFAIGGQNQTEILPSIERYDQVYNSWKLMCPLPKPLRCMSAASFRGKLYVFGGETIGEICKAAYRYDVVNDSWLELPPMHTPRALAGCVVHKDRIYLIGGNTAISSKWRKEFLPEHCVSSVEVFDPLTNTWSAGPELPNALCGAGIVKIGNSTMVVGGEDDKSWMAGSFTLQEEEGREFWVEGQELPTVMSTFGCLVANIPKELIKEDH